MYTLNSKRCVLPSPVPHAHLIHSHIVGTASEDSGGIESRRRQVLGAIINLVTIFSENFQHVGFDVLPLLRLAQAATTSSTVFAQTHDSGAGIVDGTLNDTVTSIKHARYLVLGASAASFLEALGVRRSHIIVAIPEVRWPLAA